MEPTVTISLSEYDKLRDTTTAFEKILQENRKETVVYSNSWSVSRYHLLTTDDALISMAKSAEELKQEIKYLKEDANRPWYRRIFK